MCSAIVNPVGYVVASALFGIHPLTGFAGYAFASCFAAAPLMVFAGVAAAMQRAQAGAAVRWATRTGVVVFPMMSLAAQVVSWKDIGSDAQAALLFVFLPFWAGVVSVVVVGLAALVGAMTRS
jgi:hypothetical protein